MHQPMCSDNSSRGLKFTYSILRRDNRGIILLEEVGTYQEANRKKEFLQGIADRRHIAAKFYVKLHVEEI